MNRIRYMRQEAGVAMITVIVLSAVLMMIGGGMFYVATRENTMTSADYVGGQAFYYAEGGIENAIDIINYAATETQLTTPRPDQSSDNGEGYLMDPTPANRADPLECPVPTGSGCDPIMMKIGSDEYTVWVDIIDEAGNHCETEACKLNPANQEPAYLLITAEGESGDGYRKLRQQVKVQGSGFPMGMFIKGDVDANGTPTIVNQSIYVEGNIYQRDNMKIDCRIPSFCGNAEVGAYATGNIFAKQKGSDTQIYTGPDPGPAGYPSADFCGNCDNDHDKWGPVGEEFTVDDLNAIFATSGLSSSQLLVLKSMAITDGYYANPVDGTIFIEQKDLPSRDGNIAIYVDYSGGNNTVDNLVKIKIKWPDLEADPSYTGNAMIVVRHGSVEMEGGSNSYLRGFVYCPEGPVTTHGTGGGSFTGYVWATASTDKNGNKVPGLVDRGNFDFVMDPNFWLDPPFISWTVVRKTDWEEVDR